MATNTKKTDKPLKTDETSSATRKTYPVRLRTELQNKLEEESEHLIQEGYQVQEASGVELIRRLVDARYGFFGLPPEQASLIEEDLKKSNLRFERYMQMVLMNYIAHQNLGKPK